MIFTFFLTEKYYRFKWHDKSQERNDYKTANVYRKMAQIQIQIFSGSTP